VSPNSRTLRPSRRDQNSKPGPLDKNGNEIPPEKIPALVPKEGGKEGHLARKRLQKNLVGLLTVN